MLFGKLPEFFADEAELRALWSDSTTRRKLLEGLAETYFPQVAPTVSRHFREGC